MDELEEPVEYKRAHRAGIRALIATIVLVPCSMVLFASLCNASFPTEGVFAVWIASGVTLALGVHSFVLGCRHERRLAFISGLLAIAASIGWAAFFMIGLAWVTASS